MIDAYLGEIRMFAIGYAPTGWVLCNGQIMPIQQNQALYALLGTTYGGDGQTTFRIPDLRGRAIVSQADGLPMGTASGAETVTLSTSEIPQHLHTWTASTLPATAVSPNNAFLAVAGTQLYSASPQGLVMLASTTLGNAGGTQPHDNMQPFVTMSYCMAVQGIFPSPT